MKREINHVGTKLCENSEGGSFMNKSLSLLLVLTLIIGLFAMPMSFADSGDKEFKEIYSRILDEYMQYEEFQTELKENRDEALRMIEDLANKEILANSSIQPRGGTMGEAYDNDVELSIQADTYTCAYANILQVMYGLEKEHLIAGSTDEAKQRTIETEMGNYGSSPYVYQVKNYLNQYVSSSAYAYYLGTSISTESDFANRVATSLVYERPVLLHAKTAPLGYYKGENLGHYLTVDYINQYTDTIRIVDTNYDPEFGGIHYVSQTEAYRTINWYSSRYLISY